MEPVFSHCALPSNFHSLFFTTTRPVLNHMFIHYLLLLSPHFQRVQSILAAHSGVLVKCSVLPPVVNGHLRCLYVPTADGAAALACNSIEGLRAEQSGAARTQEATARPIWLLEVLGDMGQLEPAGLLRRPPSSDSNAAAENPTLRLCQPLLELAEYPRLAQRSLEKAMLCLKQPLLPPGQLAAQLGAPASFCQWGGALHPPFCSTSRHPGLKDSLAPR